MPRPRYIAAIMLVFLLSACATQTYIETDDAPGFWSGIWHGFIVFFSLIGHIFDNEIRIYAYPNSGGWYDFGFFLGLGSWGSVAAIK